DVETRQRPQDPARDLAAVRDEHLLEHQGAVVTTAFSSHTRRRIGVGFQPLHGLLSCGQFEITTSASVSACSSTYAPGREIPSTMSSRPSGVTGTFMKKLMFATMSRFPIPSGARAWRKLSRQLCIGR